MELCDYTNYHNKIKFKRQSDIEDLFSPQQTKVRKIKLNISETDDESYLNPKIEKSYANNNSKEKMDIVIPSEEEAQATIIYNSIAENLNKIMISENQLYTNNFKCGSLVKHTKEKLRRLQRQRSQSDAETQFDQNKVLDIFNISDEEENSCICLSQNNLQSNVDKCRRSSDTFKTLNHSKNNDNFSEEIHKQQKNLTHKKIRLLQTQIEAADRIIRNPLKTITSKNDSIYSSGEILMNKFADKLNHNNYNKKNSNYFDFEENNLKEQLSKTSIKKNYESFFLDIQKTNDELGSIIIKPLDIIKKNTRKTN